MDAVPAVGPPPLSGEPLALDLLDTEWVAGATPVDLLATPEGTRAWLDAAGFAATPASGAAGAALGAARQAIRDVVSGGGAAATERLNAVLGHGRQRLSLGPDLSPRRQLEVGDPAWRPAVAAAVNLLELLDRAPDRVRRCQNPGCVLWFYDTSRNGTRRWCSMAVCGNRAKARRHYDRARRPGPC